MFFFWLLRIVAAFFLAQLPSLQSGAHSFLPDQTWTSESDQSSVDCCKMQSLQLLNCWTCMIIKRWKYNPHERRCSPCVCVCVCACVRVCVCACAARSKTDKQRTLLSFGASKRSNTLKTCKKQTAGLKSIHLYTVYILKWTRTVGRKLCVSIFCLKVTLINSSMLIKEKITHSSYSE